jgi:acyl-CoA synthetase (AMP-forming)/AMP-acid ligase II
MNLNLADFLLDGAPAERTALLTEAGEHTYGELRAHVGGVARALSARGVMKGDRVGLLADNSLFWIASYLGALKLGAVVVPFAPSVRPEQLATLAISTGCRAFCLAPKYQRFTAALAPGTAVVASSAPGEPIAGVDVDERHDLAALMFTSGSTGAPRAVMVSHRNIIANTQGILEYLELDERERIMVVLPFHYCFGASLLHTHLRVGGTLVLNNHFAFPQLVLEQLASAACTGLAGVPSTYQLLLRSSDFRKRAFPALRKLQQAGGKLPDVFIEELRQSFPDARYYLMYGQTEATARLSYLPPSRLGDKLGSIGRGMSGVELRVLRADGSPAGVGEVGEVVARGESVTLGYWQDPAQTAQTFRDGALWTGDLARADDEGFLFVVDRARDFLKPSGHRTAAKEIEDYLVALPEVVEAAVIGVPDDLLGEVARAFVVLRRGALLGSIDVLDHCKRVMPGYMVPREVVLLRSLPKASSGKVAKVDLKKPDVVNQLSIATAVT